MVLKAWVDDSEDNQTFALGGFISLIGTWDVFSSDWIKTCRDRPRIGVYKTNHALGLKNEFEGFSQSARNSKVANLARVIPPAADRYLERIPPLKYEIPRESFKKLIANLT